MDAMAEDAANEKDDDAPKAPVANVEATLVVKETLGVNVEAVIKAGRESRTSQFQRPS